MANSPASKRITPERWERVKDVTADALELEAESREAFVVSACAGDADLLQEVQRLLNEASRPPGILDNPVWDVHRDAHCFSPGQVVGGRFRIIRFLNRGGMGEVYSASDLELKESVALKAIRASIAASQSNIDRFKDEVRQTRRITHPNICRVYDLFSHEQVSGETVWFLTMELLEGVSLAERLATSGPLTTTQAIPLIKEMVAALSTAHDLGIVHRDFKPNNVMLVGSAPERERAVVTDFGLALSVVSNLENESSGAADGTPAYMAPERLAGVASGFAADQFALGLVICEMLTGTKPELGRSSVEESRKQVNAWVKSQPKERLTARAQSVIARCLEFRPEDRFSNVRDIFPVLEGGRKGLRTRWAIAAGFGIAATLAGVAVLANRDWGDRVTGAVRLTPATDLAGYPNLSRDGKLIAYMSDGAEPGNLDIWIQALPGGVPRRLTTHPTEDREPSISPDGRRVAFRSERSGGGIYTIGVDGRGERLIVPGGRFPVFSPDGGKIAYWSGDEGSPSGRSYVISVNGGLPRRIAPDFADARYPIWSSDGHLILFEGCRTVAPLSACTDWWIMRTESGTPSSLRMSELLKTNSIEPRHDKTWRGDRMVFSGMRGGLTSLWELTVSGMSLQVEGRPRRITADEAIELEPSLAETGTIAFGRGSAGRHIWRIPVRPTAEGAREVRVTNDPQMDDCPAVSPDGHRLFFARRIGDSRQLIMKELVSGRESVLFASDADKFWPIPDRTGDRIAFESRSKGESSLWLIARGQATRMLCTNCSSPTSWFHSGRGIFHTTATGEIALLDAGTGVSQVVLAGEERGVLGEADWNPATEYILFTAGRDGASKQVFAARFPRSKKVPQGSWIPITTDPEAADRPHWSNDGRTLFYMSRRDGFYCIWRQRFDAANGAVVGDPQPVMHYHNQRFSPRRIVSNARGLSVAEDSIFVNIGEWTVAIWQGLLQRPVPFLD